MGDLAVGQTKVFDIFVQVNANVLPNTLLTNVVTATTATTSTLWTSRVTVQAQSVADLAVRKFGKPDGEVRASDTLTYTVIVDNYGPGVAHSVVVTDLLVLDGVYSFAAVGCTPSSGANVSGNTQLTCALGSMQPGAQRIFTVTVTAAEAQAINNVAGANSLSD